MGLPVVPYLPWLVPLDAAWQWVNDEFGDRDDIDRVKLSRSLAKLLKSWGWADDLRQNGKGDE